MLRRSGELSPLGAVVVGVVATLSLIWAVTAWLMMRDAERFSHLWQTRAQTVADNIALHLGQTLEVQAEVARVAALTYETRHSKGQGSSFQLHYPMDKVFVLAPDGRILHSPVPPKSLSRSVIDLGAAANLLRPDELNIGVPQPDPRTGDRMVPLLYAITDAGAVKRWVAVPVPLPLPLLAASRIELGDEGFALVDAPLGQFEIRKDPAASRFTHDRRDLLQVAQESASRAQAERHQRPRTRFDPEPDGGYVRVPEDHYFVGRAEVSRFRVSVVTAISRAESLSTGSSVREVFSAVLVVVSFMLVGSLLLAWRLFKRTAAAERRMRRLANTDTLTRLANRRAHMQFLARSLHEARRTDGYVGLVYLDIDNLRQINFELGQQHGDKTLRAIAKLLASTVRRGGLVARIDGDCFAVTMPLLSNADELRLEAEWLFSCLGSLALEPGQSSAVKISLGAVLCDHQDSREAASRKADAALQEAQACGGNQVRIYDAQLEARAQQRRQLAQELKTALSKQELLVTYEPQVNVSDMSVSGYEALPRWEHPSRGTLEAGQLSAIAEETGMTDALCEAVVEQCCAQLHAWHAESGKWRRVSFNARGDTVRKRALHPALRQAMRRHHVPASSLEVEVSDLFISPEETERSLEALRELRAMGVGVVLDAFGSAGSGLSVLHRFAFSAVKADPDIVSRLGSDEPAFATMCLVTELARTMDLRVIATGVETAAQHGALQLARCSHAQGPFYTRALAVAEAA